MNENTTWTVVKFSDENTVEAVPTNWLIGNNMCYWPPYTREKVINSIRNYDEVNTCWSSHRISMFRNGTFNSYLEARNKTKVAEYSSDLSDIDDPKSRKFRKKKSVISSDESEQGDEAEANGRLPPPPRLFKPTMKKGLNPSHDVSPVNIEINEANGKLSLSPPFKHTIKKGLKPSQVSPVNSEINEDKENCHCCPIHKNRNNQIDEAMKKIMKQYYFIGNVLTDITQKLENINIIEHKTSDGRDSIFTKFRFFPIENPEHLAIFEEYLGEASNFRAASNEMSKTGGENLYELMKRCLSRLISNRLASQYSYHGKKIKQSFRNLKMADLLMSAAEQADEKTTKKEIEHAIMKWLRRASERK